jgi:hypothetical protein
MLQRPLWANVVLCGGPTGIGRESAHGQEYFLCCVICRAPPGIEIFGAIDSNNLYRNAYKCFGSYRPDSMVCRVAITA